MKNRLSFFKTKIHDLFHKPKFDAADMLINLGSCKFICSEFGTNRGCDELRFNFASPYPIEGFGQNFWLWESQLNKVTNYIMTTGHQWPQALNDAVADSNRKHSYIENYGKPDLTPQE